ncbi:hypothetical protein phiG2_27 [Lysinibacillus phage phiG2]|nr:hypothetical protein phiG2_27 [Lysinibacillus phage phiG2]
MTTVDNAYYNTLVRGWKAGFVTVIMLRKVVELQHITQEQMEEIIAMPKDV